MKKISSILLSLFLLASCTQDFVESGITQKATVSTYLSLSASPMQTRSTDPTTVADDVIANLWVVQFDETGAFMQKNYTATITDPSKVKVSLAPNEVGKKSKIYLIVNAGSTMSTPTNETSFLTFKKVLTAEADLLVSGANGKKNVLMNAVIKDITVPNSGIMPAQTVNLTRSLAKVDVKVGINSTLTSTLQIEKVRIGNIPTSVAYFAKDKANTPTNTYTTMDYPLENITSGTTITFYLPDNQRGKGTNATTDPRLKNGVDGATYVEVIGHIKGIQGGDEVSYCMYLGADNVNDYNLERNNYYSVDATINGISSSDLRVRYHKPANCYMVAPGGTVSIPVKKANESHLNLQIPDVRTGWTASVYWQSASGLVTVDNATSANGYFKVTAPSTTAEGNALVVVKNSTTNVVLWSWHIWIVKDDLNNPVNQAFSNNSTWMDRNLGATTRGTAYGATPKVSFSTSGGLYYQWGRKDPFIGTAVIGSATPALYTTYGATTSAFTPVTDYSLSGMSPTLTPSSPSAPTNAYIRYADASAAPISYTNQLLYSVRFPLLFLNNWNGSASNSSQSGYDSWAGEAGQSKSAYDPCPEGWRVPSSKKTSSTVYFPWTSALLNYVEATAVDGNCAYFENTKNNIKVPYPAVGSIGANYAFTTVGGATDYWIATATSVLGQAAYTNSVTYNFYGTGTKSRSSAAPIRCTKDWN